MVLPYCVALWWRKREQQDKKRQQESQTSVANWATLSLDLAALQTPLVAEIVKSDKRKLVTFLVSGRMLALTQYTSMTQWCESTPLLMSLMSSRGCCETSPVSKHSGQSHCVAAWQSWLQLQRSHSMHESCMKHAGPRKLHLLLKSDVWYNSVALETEITILIVLTKLWHKIKDGSEQVLW